MSFPFERTTCGCAECTACCRRQPGPLVPGDLERIAAHMGLPLEEAKRFFWASPGALVMSRSTGRQYRIGTITPKLVRKHGCVFLTPEGQCSIHAVAPAGCAMFDVHMSALEAMPRSIEMLRQTKDPEYQALRATLPFADSWKPTGY